MKLNKPVNSQDKCRVFSLLAYTNPCLGWDVFCSTPGVLMGPSVYTHVCPGASLLLAYVGCVCLIPRCLGGPSVYAHVSLGAKGAVATFLHTTCHVDLAPDYSGQLDTQRSSGTVWLSLTVSDGTVMAAGKRFLCQYLWNIYRCIPLLTPQLSHATELNMFGLGDSWVCCCRKNLGRQGASH